MQSETIRERYILCEKALQYILWCAKTNILFYRPHTFTSANYRSGRMFQGISLNFSKMGPAFLYHRNSSTDAQISGYKEKPGAPDEGFESIFASGPNGEQLRTNTGIKKISWYIPAFSSMIYLQFQRAVSSQFINLKKHYIVKLSLTMNGR